ncbi:MAG: UDP-galactopyranose mutase [Chitinophagaceae bacterium]|nr:UDP-galactopyranose mutase [Chitinophagaceae bacterium]
MDISSFPYIIAGSGLFGAVMAERIASQLNEKVLVIEKRSHIGGNCYSETDSETGIEYHKYGTHIFHTGNQKVWDYINGFTSFNTYRHQVLASVNNKIFQLPVNLETINSFFNANLRPYEVKAFMSAKTAGFKKQPANFEEQAIAVLGEELYEAFIKGYTAKQWQVDPRTLPASVFTRLPFRTNYDENYYYDQWQGIPLQGYTAVFEKLLSHPNIAVMLNTDFFSVKEHINQQCVLIYSGPIDRFFNYRFGKLEWRTLRFEKETMPYNDYQGNSVINFPDIKIPYTRVHEPKHLHPERQYEKDKTVIFREYSLKDDGARPYYPVLTEENKRMLELYRNEAEKLEHVYISGRLGDYKYYDMDQTIAKALETFETCILKKENTR